MEQNWEEAAKLFYAVNSHNKSHIAPTELGKCYEFGLGVEQDLPRAAALYEEATESYAGSAEASYRQGRMLYEGRGVEKDENRGLDLLEDAAEHDDWEAKGLLGQIYLLEEEPRQNDRKAALYLKDAAEYGYAHAQALFGDMCATVVPGAFPGMKLLLHPGTRKRRPERLIGTATVG